MLVREDVELNVVFVAVFSSKVPVNKITEALGQVRPDELVLFEQNFGGLVSDRPTDGEQLPVWFFVFVEVVKARIARDSILAEKHLSRSNAVAPNMIAQFLRESIEQIGRCAWEKK